MEIKVLASGSKGNCYRIKYRDTTLLLEAGISLKEIKIGLNFKLSEVDGCLVTHEHGDHAKSVKDLIKFGVDCYMTAGTAEALGVSGHRIKVFETINGKGDSKKYLMTPIGDLWIYAFTTIHDCQEPVGFVIVSNDLKKSLVFITDTAYMPYKLPENTTHLMVECNYIKEIMDKKVDEGSLHVSLRNRVVRNHMSLETLIEMLEANDLSRLEKVFVMHLSDSNSDEKLIKRRIQEVTGTIVEIC